MARDGRETWSLEERVELDVGGTRFVTRVETLIQARFFDNLLRSDRWAPAPKDRPIFVNRCPGLFKHVLRLLLDHAYPLPEKCFGELDFYGVDWCRNMEGTTRQAQVRDFTVPKLFQEKDLPIWVGPRHVRIHRLLVPLDALVAVALYVGDGSSPEHPWRLKIAALVRSDAVETSAILPRSKSRMCWGDEDEDYGRTWNACSLASLARTETNESIWPNVTRALDAVSDALATTGISFETKGAVASDAPPNLLQKGTGLARMWVCMPRLLREFKRLCDGGWIRLGPFFTTGPLTKEMLLFNDE